MTVDVRSPEPAWQQLAAIIAAKIEDGTYRKGDAIPSLHELHAEHGLALATIQKAIAALKDQGLVVGVPGRGTFVK